ncbi:hypothetical protein LguiB_018800 [Lonicera macranthoides]
MLKVRVVRLWETPCFEDKSQTYTIEMVFVDSQGGRIHATIKKSLLQSFKTLIREGQLYVIRNFVVGYNNLKYKTTSHKYKLNFMPRTNVVNVVDESFPSHNYTFRSFVDISSASDLDENELFDVIGEVVGKDNAKLQEYNGRMSKLIDIMLEDLELMDKGDCSSQRITALSSLSNYFISTDLASADIKTIEELLEYVEMLDNGCYPADIDALVEKKMLFKVQVKLQNVSEHNEVFTVIRLTDNDEFISKYVSRRCVEYQSNTLIVLDDGLSKDILDVDPTTQMSSNKLIKHVKLENN